MKRAIVVVALIVVGLSCLVDRRSDDFACDDDTDCTGFDEPRTCNNNVCLPITCPAICDDCEPGMVCQITCSNPNECRNGVACPAGWNCEFDCNNDCTPVTCTTALSCVVDCGTGSSCGPITCGTASPCTCTGIGCL